MMGISEVMNDVHVVPNGHGWTIEAEGINRDDLKTQVEAVLLGCRLAAGQDCEVVVHGLASEDD